MNLLEIKSVLEYMRNRKSCSSCIYICRGTAFPTRLHVRSAKTQISLCIHTVWSESSPSVFTIGIKHGFSGINIRQVPWEVLKTEAGGRGFQHLPRDLANVNTLKNHVRSLLLHKNCFLCSKDNSGTKASSCGQWLLKSDCEDAQTDPSLRRAHM